MQSATTAAGLVSSASTNETHHHRRNAGRSLADVTPDTQFAGWPSHVSNMREILRATTSRLVAES